MPLPSPDWLPQASTVSLGGLGTVEVRDSGPSPTGSTLLLLHGWTVTADLNWYRCYEPLVAAGHRVIAFDQRGHGHGLRVPGRFTLEACVADAVRVIDELGIDRVTAVGYSMGGCIAQLLARDHADRLDGLVLCATARRFRGRGRERAWFSLLHPIAGTTRRVPPTARHRVFGHLLGRRSLTGDVGPWALAELAKADPQSLLDAGTALYGFDSTSWLATITTPTSVVITERDATVPAHRQHRLADAIPDASRHSVEGGHTVCVNAPARFLPPLEAALTDVGTDRRAGGTPQALNR